MVPANFLFSFSLYFSPLSFKAFSFLIDDWIASIARIEVSEARPYDITHHASFPSRYQHPCDSGDNASQQYPQSLEDESTCYV